MEEGQSLVLCVCHGNIGRSPIMEAYLRKAVDARGLGGRIMCRSAGIMGTCNEGEPKHAGPPGARIRNPLSHCPVWQHVEPLLAVRGIDIREHTFRPVNRALVDRADLVLASDVNVLANGDHALAQQFPDAFGKMMLFTGLISRTLNVPDFGGNGRPEICAEAMRMMDECVRDGLPNLFRLLGIESAR